MLGLRGGNSLQTGFCSEESRARHGFSCITRETAFACLHVGMLNVCFCSTLSSWAASGVSEEGCWRRKMSTARQQQLSSAADEEISNRNRQEEGKMLQIYRNKGLAAARPHWLTLCSSIKFTVLTLVATWHDVLRDSCQDWWWVCLHSCSVFIAAECSRNTPLSFRVGWCVRKQDSSSRLPPEKRLLYGHGSPLSSLQWYQATRLKFRGYPNVHDMCYALSYM